MTDLLKKVFSSLNAFDSPFTVTCPSRVLIFPTRGYLLTDRQFNALATAAKSRGATSGLCVITEALDLSDLPDKSPTHQIDFSSYMSYQKLGNEGCILQENAIISERGDWGVLISQEFHAVLGGSKEFVEVFKGSYPEIESDRQRFITAMHNEATRIGSDISWLPKLVSHLSEST
jgi:hypothetical protein